jgi:hypothetical protein
VSGRNVAQSRGHRILLLTRAEIVRGMHLGGLSLCVLGGFGLSLDAQFTILACRSSVDQ